jgi:ABC-type Fe3+ transport system substrate-binding protein
MTSVDFIGNVAFSLNRAFEEHLAYVKSDFSRTTGKSFYYKVTPVCEEDSLNSIISNECDDDLPALIATIGFEAIFNYEFVKKNVRKQIYGSGWNSTVNSLFESAGLVDPYGIYGIHAVTPYVFLVDLQKLSGRPCPNTWEDLLDSRYAGDIVVNGSATDFSYILLLYIYMEFGDSGLKQLSRNVREAMHGACIARYFGTEKASSPAVAVLPWLFAQSCPRKKNTLVIWPEDGAIVSPMIVLKKFSCDKSMYEICSRIFGSRFGKMAVTACFPYAGAGGEDGISSNGKLKWLGWNFIREHDMMQLISYVRMKFSEWRCK